jgi:hypothetical protein
MSQRLLGRPVADGIIQAAEHQQAAWSISIRDCDALEAVVVGQALAQRNPLPGAAAHELERPLGHADLAHAVVDPPRAEPPLRDLGLPSRFADPDVLEETSPCP